MPVAMPDPAVPSGGAARESGVDQDRDSHMYDVDFGPKTLLEEKMVDNKSPGTAGDETGIAAEIIRRNVKRSSQEY